VDPNNFEARKNLGNAYVLDGNLQDALDSFKEARDLRPDDVSVYVNLAYVYQQMNEIELAWENIETAREIDPSYPLLHYRAGELFRAQGMDEQAIAAFTDYISLEPDSLFAQDARAIIDSLTLENNTTAPGDGQSLEEEVTPPEDEALTEETDQTELEEPTEEEIAAEEEVTEEAAPVEEEPEPAVEEPAPEEETPADETPTEEAPPEETTQENHEATNNLPDLEGDDLYNDRLRRGRQMRAIGSTAAAINLLLQAYEVHPDYAQVNYELGMAYLLDGQTDTGVNYLERYLDLETDPALRAEVENRIQAVRNAGGGSDESDTSSGEGDGSTSDGDG
jgi:tetratricopeptide (TPR) repeat protein